MKIKCIKIFINRIKKKYINVKKIHIESKEDFIKIAYIFRNLKIRTFRVIYMRDDKIVDYESISSQIPYKIMIINNKKKARYKNEIYEIAEKMYRLNANGYYLMRNGRPKAEIADIQLVRRISNDLKGLKGYIISNWDTYAFISREENKIIIESKLKIDNFAGQNPEEYLKTNPKLNIQIRCKDDLARLMQHIRNTNKYSILILTDYKYNIRLLKEIPDTFINMSYGEISKYIKDEEINTNSNKAFFVTTDKLFYERTKPLINSNIIEDSISYIVVNNNMYIENEGGTQNNELCNNNKSKTYEKKYNTISIT